MLTIYESVKYVAQNAFLRWPRIIKIIRPGILIFFQNVWFPLMDEGGRIKLTWVGTTYLDKKVKVNCNVISIQKDKSYKTAAF